MKRSFILIILLSGLVFAQKYDPLTGEEIKIEKFDPLTGNVIDEKEPDSEDLNKVEIPKNVNSEDVNIQRSVSKSISQSMVGEIIKINFFNESDLTGKITSQNKNYVTVDIDSVGEAIIPRKNIKSFYQEQNNKTFYTFRSVEKESDKRSDELEFKRNLDIELSKHSSKSGYATIGVMSCIAAPFTAGLSIPIIAIYRVLPENVEPKSEFYKNLPFNDKMKYKTEFNRMLTEKKKSGIRNGVLGSVGTAALGIGLLILSW